MPASRKLRTAHFLMFIGVAPMVLAVAFSVAGIAYARSHPGLVGGSDGFLTIALGLFGYVTTVVLGGAGALWSWFLTARGIDQRTTATLVLRTLVAAAIVLPPLGYRILVFTLS
jgi:hypothetical protein